MSENGMIILSVVLIVGGLFWLFAAADSSGRKQQEKLFESIDYTELVAVYSKSAVFLVHYKDGRVVRDTCDYSHSYYAIFQAKCIGRRF